MLSINHAKLFAELEWEYRKAKAIEAGPDARADVLFPWANKSRSQKRSHFFTESKPPVEPVV